MKAKIITFSRSGDLYWMEVFHTWERLTISQTGPLNGSNHNKRKPEQFELCLNIDHIIIHVQKYSDKHTYLL